MNDTSHLTPEQETKIREIAARIYAAGEGCQDTCSSDVAQNIVSYWTIAECLSTFNDDHLEELMFDPATGRGL